MRSPLVRLEVVPSSNRERYEKSLIGQLFGNGAGPDSSPRVAKSKEPPPPVKAKPVFKPSENPATRLAEDAVSVEAAASVSCSASSWNIFRLWTFWVWKSHLDYVIIQFRFLYYINLQQQENSFLNNFLDDHINFSTSFFQPLRGAN